VAVFSYYCLAIPRRTFNTLYQYGEVGTTAALRAAIYVRVSTDVQDTNTQLKQVYEIAPPDAKIFTEHQSAFKDSLKVRPIFSDLKRRITNREFTALYVWDFDRLYRNRKQALAFMSLCQHYGCTVYSYRQRWFEELEKIPAPWDEIFRKFLFEVLAWVAEDESDQKSKRIKKAIVRGEITESYRGKKWGRPATNIDREKIKSLLELDKSYRDIAKMLGVSHTTVATVKKTLTKTLKEKPLINEV